MTTVLIVEDDDAIRNNVVRLLKLEGYEIESATDGRSGLERARALRPDVIISDVSMPEMDGFELLEAVRGDRDLAGTSFMLLTALDDRASMRRGMTAGADDYLAKPFTRVELLDALQGLLKKRGRIEQTIESAIRSREEDLRRAFGAKIGGLPPAVHAAALVAAVGAQPQTVVDATVLYSDIRGFTSVAEKLNSQEVARLLTEYFHRVCGPALGHGGKYLRFIGDGLVAVFLDTSTPGGPQLPAARRAISAALGMALVTHEFRAWIASEFGERGLPPFAIGIGLHAGEVALCQTGPLAGQADGMAASGETVDITARLQAASKEFGWTVVASQAALRPAGRGVQTGGMTSLAVGEPDRFVDVAEILGLESGHQDRIPGMATLAEREQEVREAVRINSEITARAVKGALESKLAAFRDHPFDAGGEPLRLKGYRLTRKIGSGGMTDVFLAEREADGLAVVLKVLDASGKSAGEHLARFIQEYALLSGIDHRHVVRIFDQGFTDDHAYIAMEHFEGGDLRAEITAGMTPQRVLEVVGELAQALDAIHERKVIHRDLKPENVMRRADGSVALADFGIAKSMLGADALAFTRTRHGDVVGTPYYLSPEQASGGEVTPQSDLYSLGVMLYEMLTGERPYSADSLDLLLARHVSAPTPTLPPPHAALQPVLDRLMAKQPQERYPSAGALLQDLRACGASLVGEALERTWAEPAG